LNHKIVILCHGGQSNSLLAKALFLCGVNFGNKETMWNNAWYNDHMENRFVTRLMLDVGNQDEPNTDYLERTSLLMLSAILRKYNKEGMKNGWEHWCIKTTSGICPNKWPKVRLIFDEELPEAIYIGVIRKPLSDGTFDNWMSTIEARLDIVDRLGGVYFPFPDIFTSQLHTLKTFFETCLGLNWNPYIECIYDPDKHTHVADSIDNKNLKKQYDYLIQKSRVNILALQEKVSKVHDNG